MEQLYTGCKSQDFLQNELDAGKECRQIITLERLYHNFCGESLYKNIYRFPDYEDRLKFIVEQTKQMTGLTDFGAYMCKLLTIDAFFLNEDRHTHNIAVIWDGKDGYDYCPFFDQGAGSAGRYSHGLSFGAGYHRTDSPCGRKDILQFF